MKFQFNGLIVAEISLVTSKLVVSEAIRSFKSKCLRFETYSKHFIFLHKSIPFIKFKFKKVLIHIVFML